MEPEDKVDQPEHAAEPSDERRPGPPLRRDVLKGAATLASGTVAAFALGKTAAASEPQPIAAATPMPGTLAGDNIETTRPRSSKPRPCGPRQRRPSSIHIAKTRRASLPDDEPGPADLRTTRTR